MEFDSCCAVIGGEEAAGWASVEGFSGGVASEVPFSTTPPAFAMVSGAIAVVSDAFALLSDGVGVAGSATEAVVGGAVTLDTGSDLSPVPLHATSPVAAMATTKAAIAGLKTFAIVYIPRKDCHELRRSKPTISDTTNRRRKITNSTLAISAAPAAIPVKPRTAAMIAITKNTTA